MDQDLERSLRTAIGFTDADLAANRGGRLADTQAPRLLASAFSVWTLAALVAWPAWLLLGVYWFRSGLWSSEWGALWVACVLYFARHLRPCYRLCQIVIGLALGGVRSVEGRLSTSVSSETFEEPVEEAIQSDFCT